MSWCRFQIFRILWSQKIIAHLFFDSTFPSCHDSFHAQPLDLSSYSIHTLAQLAWFTHAGPIPHWYSSVRKESLLLVLFCVPCDTPSSQLAFISTCMPENNQNKQKNKIFKTFSTNFKIQCPPSCSLLPVIYLHSKLILSYYNTYMKYPRIIWIACHHQFRWVRNSWNFHIFCH